MIGREPISGEGLGMGASPLPLSNKYEISI